MRQAVSPLSGNRHSPFRGVCEPPLAVRGDASEHANQFLGVGMVAEGVEDCQACFFAFSILRDSLTPALAPFVHVIAYSCSTHGCHTPLKRPEERDRWKKEKGADELPS